MTDGLSIAQQGVDISHALDSQKILDSRWRYLEIAQEKLITLPTTLDSASQTSGAQPPIYHHNMGFLPLFEVYDTVLQEYIAASPANILLDGTSVASGLVSDTQNLFFNNFFNYQGWNGHQALVRIYNVPITEAYSAPIQQTLASQESAPSSSGIKISDRGADLSEIDLTRFTLNTNGKALAIQRTGLTITNSGNNFETVIDHNLGYPPLFMATYADLNLQWVSTMNPDFLAVKAMASNNDLTFQGIQAALTSTFAYIIFKEPGDLAV